MGKWPEGISDGLILPCAICKCWVMFDYNVDDAFWSLTVPIHIRRDVVCLPCLDTLASAMGLDIATNLRQVQFTGIGKTIVLLPEKTFYHNEYTDN